MLLVVVVVLLLLLLLLMMTLKTGYATQMDPYGCLIPYQGNMMISLWVLSDKPNMYFTS